MQDSLSLGKKKQTLLCYPCEFFFIKLCKDQDCVCIIFSDKILPKHVTIYLVSFRYAKSMRVFTAPMKCLKFKHMLLKNEQQRKLLPTLQVLLGADIH